MTYHKADPTIKRLKDWENVNAMEHLRKTELAECETVENRVKLINDRYVFSY